MPAQRPFSRAYGSGIKGRRTAAAARGLASEGAAGNETGASEEAKDENEDADEDVEGVQREDYDAQTHLQVWG
jgi:hypothetical protein